MSSLKDALQANAEQFFKYTKSVSDAVTIVVKSVSDYDPSTGSQTTTTTSTTVDGLLLKFRESQIDGTTILREDRRLLIPVSGMSPDTNDEAIVSGTRYRIISVRGDISGSYWDMQIRKL